MHLALAMLLQLAKNKQSFRKDYEPDKSLRQASKQKAILLYGRLPLPSTLPLQTKHLVLQPPFELHGYVEVELKANLYCSQKL